MPGQFEPNLDTGGEEGGGGDGGGGGGGGGAGGGGGSGGGVAARAVARMETAPVTFQVPVRRETADRAVRGPAYPVPRGAIVEVSPSGTIAGADNTQNAFVSIVGPEAAQRGPRVILTPTGNPRQVKVENLAEVWVYSTVVGEGALITLRQGN